MRVHVARFMVDHWLGGLIVLRYATKHDTVRPCPDLYHEVFNEPDCDEVLTDLVCWAPTRQRAERSRQGRITRAAR
ncbi:MAG TPA: hypothetical protein VHH52_10585 [Pseudonocardiaceae bacterium]|nr:hypothetical protein [Pseudonocardiaceae bacterium]